MTKGKKESSVEFAEKAFRDLLASAKTDKQKLLVLREFTKFLQTSRKIAPVDDGKKNFFNKG